VEKVPNLADDETLKVRSHEALDLVGDNQGFSGKRLADMINSRLLVSRVGHFVLCILSDDGGSPADIELRGLVRVVDKYLR
jgi:hypothetical protein